MNKENCEDCEVNYYKDKSSFNWEEALCKNCPEEQQGRKRRTNNILNKRIVKYFEEKDPPIDQNLIFDFYHKFTDKEKFVKILENIENDDFYKEFNLIEETIKSYKKAINNLKSLKKTIIKDFFYNRMEDSNG